MHIANPLSFLEVRVRLVSENFARDNVSVSSKAQRHPASDACTISPRIQRQQRVDSILELTQCKHHLELSHEAKSHCKPHSRH
jgi:hypothetical protein